MDNKQNVIPIVSSVVVEFNENLERKIPVERGLDAPLYGREGGLDSLGFVSFVVAVEQAIDDELGFSVTLADKKAMSQRNSPFRTIGTLVDYIVKLIPDQERH